MKEIIEDLSRRNLKVVAFICENEEGGLQLLSYDKEGLVSFLSSVAENGITVNAKVNGNVVRSVAVIPGKES